MKNTHVIKCPNCGADMVYDPKTQGLICPYCDGKKEIEKAPAPKKDFHAERANSVTDNNAYKYVCPNCGGEVDFDAYVTATKCPFCSATNVVKTPAVEGLNPDGILPFLYTKEMAMEAGKKWIKSKVFALGSFKKNFKAENLEGLYIPSYVFATNTHTKYTARLGKTCSTGSGKNRRTYTRWFTVSGDFARAFKNVLVEATRHITQGEIQKINPFDLANLEAYKQEYVAGFSAERNNESLDQGFLKAKEVMQEIIKNEVLSNYTYDVVGSFNADISYSDIGFNYALVPIYMFGCKHKEKEYRYIVNGRTGRSYGKYPLSPVKVASVVLFVLAIIGFIVYMYLTQ